MREINFDGIVGPSHNYAGLSPGNLAATRNAGHVAHPRAAALQGIAKMRANLALGLTQGILLPHPRPDHRWLAALATDYAHAAPHLRARALSASAMWAANAATVSPAADSDDACCHLTVANLVTMPHRKAQLGELLNADWLGIAGLALGLGGLTVVLEEGQREQWFQSHEIVMLSILSAIGFVLLFAGQVFARRPVIKLSLLLDRQFGSVAMMGIVVGMVLYGTSYVIPQFLAAIADYDALQSGKVVLLSGIPSLMLMPFTPLMIRHLDIRIAVAAGMLIMATSCGIDTVLTAQSTGGSFVDSQLLRGVGTILCFLFLNQAAIASVPPEDAGDAAGLFNAVRNLGGSFALAGIATIQDQRMWLHSRRMEESLDANSGMVQDYLNGLGQALGGADAALRAMAGTIQRDALVMTFNDIFWLLAVGILCVIPLVLFLRPLPKGQSIAMH